MSVLRLIPAKGEAIVVDADEALVGRESNCNVVVAHPSVSRRHALLKRKQDVFFVVDQGSANGTFVDSKRVVDAALREGTVLRFGSAAFKVEVRDDVPVESVAEDDLVIASTMVGQSPTFASTVLEGSPVPDDGPVSHDEVETVEDEVETEDPLPTVQAPLPVLSRPAEPRADPKPQPRAEPRPEPRRAPPAPPAFSPPPSVPSAPASTRGPAFWLMIGAGALALLFVGAALGLGAAFIARKLGWL